MDKTMVGLPFITVRNPERTLTRKIGYTGPTIFNPGLTYVSLA